VHYNAAGGAHFASFDMRVAGSQVRTLIDTGATCSCISSQFAKKLGLQWQQHHNYEGIGGVGGEVSVLGTLMTTVNLRKEQVSQTFLVLREPIAGYDCLLGQNFLKANSAGIFYTPLSVGFTLRCDENGHGDLFMSRRLMESVSVTCDRH
jgi:predicted aspartyl protease